MTESDSRIPEADRPAEPLPPEPAGSEGAISVPPPIPQKKPGFLRRLFMSRRKQQALAVQNGYLEIVDLIRAIRTHLDRQEQVQTHVLAMLEKVPDAMDRQHEVLSLFRQQLESNMENDKRLTDSMGRLSGSLDAMNESQKASSRTITDLIGRSRETEQLLREVMRRAERRMTFLILFFVVLVLGGGAALFYLQQRAARGEPALPPAPAAAEPAVPAAEADGPEFLPAPVEPDPAPVPEAAAPVPAPEEPLPDTPAPAAAAEPEAEPEPEPDPDALPPATPEPDGDPVVEPPPAAEDQARPADATEPAAEAEPETDNPPEPDPVEQPSVDETPAAEESAMPQESAEAPAHGSLAAGADFTLDQLAPDAGATAHELLPGAETPAVSLP